MFQHDITYGRHIWREFFDRGQWHVNTRERRLDGTPIDIEGDYICLRDAEQRIIGHFGIQRDVTEQVRLQAEVAQHAAQLEAKVIDRTAALQRSEQRIRAIVNALPDLVVVTDGEGRYLEIANEDPRRLYRNTTELLGRCFHDVLPVSVADPLLGVTRRTLEAAVPQVLEYPLESADGRRWFEARTSPMRSGTADDRSVVMIVRDITDRKRAGELEVENLYLKEAFDADLRFGEIVGRSAAMQNGI